MTQFLNVKDGVFLIKSLRDHTVALIDQKSTVRIINPKNFKVIGGFKSKQEHAHRILNIVDISSTGKYALIGLPKKNKAALFLTQEKKLLTTIGEHKGEVEAVAISADEEYLATGGTDGRTFIYHTGATTPFIALPPRSDYITCISFTEDSRIIAFGSFDRTITIKNISLMNDSFTLKGHHGPIKKLQFLSSQYLLAVDKEGSVVIWDLHTRAVKTRLPKMLEEILDMTLDEDKRFLFVSTIYGNIGLYDLEKFERITGTYIKAEGRVNALAIDYKEKLLIYGTQEGELKGHSLLSGEDELIAAIENRDFLNAYKQVEENVLLSFSNYYIELEALWEKNLDQAKQLFGKGQHQVAMQILQPFSEVARKKAIVNKVSKEFEEFQKFKTFVREQKYALAYPLAIKHPLYQETKEYQLLENTWETQFSKAKKSILARTGEDQAREFLTLFRGVSHKAKLITDLFSQRKIYTLFRSKLAKKDFLVIFQLIESYPFLRDMKEYKELKTWGDSVYIKIQQAYQTQDYVTAIKYSKMIKDFPEFKDEVQALLDHAQIYIAFKHAIEVQDLHRVYDLLEHNSFLANLPGLQGIDFQWEDILSKIDAPMSAGNMHEVLYLLKPYPHASHKKRHIMILVKTTYLNQLELAIEQGESSEHIIQAILNLYAIFGRDELLMLFIESYKKKYNVEVDLTQTKPGNLLMFNLNKLPMSILD